MHAIEVEKLTKIYGKRETAVAAIADATFQVKPGELVAILGPSGSGKTARPSWSSPMTSAWWRGLTGSFKSATAALPAKKNNLEGGYA